MKLGERTGGQGNSALYDLLYQDQINNSAGKVYCNVSSIYRVRREAGNCTVAQEDGV